MNKRIRTAVGGVTLVTAGLIGGGIFATTPASAQVEPAPAETTVADTGAAADDTEAKRGKRGRHGHRGHRGAELAELFGIERDDLKAALRDGSTLVEIGAENGVSEDELVAAIVESRTEHIEAGVENGRITQEQADERLAELEERVTERVNRVPGERVRGDG